MAVAAGARDRAEGNNRDNALIRRIRAGDEAAYAELWHKYHNLFLNWVRRWLRFPEWERECADHALAVLFEELPKYEPGRSAFCSWAHMVGRSAIVKHIHDLSIDRADFPLDDIVEDLMPALVGPLDDFVAGRIREEVRNLAPQQGAAVGGHYFEDKTDDEIAAELHIPRRRVNYRKQQGLAELKERLCDVASTWIRPEIGFSRDSYMMASARQNISALLGGRGGDCL